MRLFFADHTLDTDRRELRHGSEPVAVEPQVFDLLIYLIQNRDRVVSKDDLIASVWDGRIVSESTLTSRINAARKAVGDSGEGQSSSAPSRGGAFVSSAKCSRDQMVANLSRPSGQHPTSSMSMHGQACRHRTDLPSLCFHS